MPRKSRVVTAPPIAAGARHSSGISGEKRTRKSPRARAEERLLEEAIRMSLSPTPVPPPKPPKHPKKWEVSSLIEDPVCSTGSRRSRSVSPGVFHGFESPSDAKTPPEKCLRVEIGLAEDSFPLAKYRSRFEKALSELKTLESSGLDGQLYLENDYSQANETILSLQGIMKDPEEPFDEFFSSPKPEVIEEKSNCVKLVEEAINSYEEYRKNYEIDEDASSSVSSCRWSEEDEECEAEEVTFLHCSGYSTSFEDYDDSESEEEEEEEEEEGKGESGDEIKDTRLTPTNFPELMLNAPTSVYQCELCDKTYKGWNDTIRDHMMKIHFSKISLTDEERRYYLMDVEKFVVRRPVLFYQKKRVNA